MSALGNALTIGGASILGLFALIIIAGIANRSGGRALDNAGAPVPNGRTEVGTSIGGIFLLVLLLFPILGLAGALLAVRFLPEGTVAWVRENGKPDDKKDANKLPIGVIPADQLAKVRWHASDKRKVTVPVVTEARWAIVHDKTDPKGVWVEPINTETFKVERFGDEYVYTFNDPLSNVRVYQAFVTGKSRPSKDVPLTPR